MSEFNFSIDTFLALHEWVQVAAYVSVLAVIAYAVWQLVSSRPGRARRRSKKRGSLRRRLLVGMLLAGTMPALTLGLLLSERSAHQREDRLSERLEKAANATAQSVDQFIDKHRSGIATAASAISAANDMSSERLNDWLMIYHEVYGDFLTMLVADDAGSVVTATSNMSGVLGPVPTFTAHDISDRDYFRTPMATGAAFLSRVFEGRGLGKDPIVAVSAPLTTAEGRPVGIVEGSLNLRAFSRLEERRSDADAIEIILVDQDSRVIFASATTGLKELEPISSHSLLRAAEEHRNSGSFRFSIDSDQRQEHFLGAKAATNLGWTVYLRAPLSGISSQMATDYRMGAALLLLAFFISLLLARGIVKRLTSSIGEIYSTIADFRLDGSVESRPTPANAPTEFRPIFKQMRRSSRALQKAHRRLNNSIEAGDKLRQQLTLLVSEREAEIQSRTEQLERANERLNALNKVDALTGIPNRREFDEVGERIWRAGRREKQMVSIILMDIDHFKEYNDLYGHLEGDACLRMVAKALVDCASRPLDLIARYGGEEFAAVLGNTDTRQALVVAERMRRAIHELGIEHDKNPNNRVTISLGVASANPVTGAKIEATIKAADDALYYAKDNGRDCTAFISQGEYEVVSGDSQLAGTVASLKTAG